MAADPLPELVTVTVFMERLRVSAARTEVFRVHPISFEEAVDVALNAEYNFRSARPGWSAGSASSSSGGFKLVESSPQYRDDVLTIGESAETALLTFLKQHYIAARGAQNILKSLHKLHKDGSLNQYILRYQQLQASVNASAIERPRVLPLSLKSAPKHTELRLHAIDQVHQEHRQLLQGVQVVLHCYIKKKYKLRISDEAIRPLRLTMNTTVASAALLPEAIDVICDSLTERNSRRTCLKDVREWLVEPPPAEPEDAATEGEQKHYVRKLLNWKRQNRETFYLVNWEPTREPRHHLHASVVAAFETERRLLVRKKFFEDEAVEDDTLNETEA
ncbi:hypothetical protein PPTG_18359 [Phytophthora nicotianae INRA-310]|uniref:Chromo domain-containing protein n=1 Tax=Phytophthora nicotianae (strain INRA-310) TaxID=761204 RepID=W2PIW5_PHYN3|nr:hypothetical protein PPTG_18359 [Phytophthora nicotianae INRA-310]ETM99969.1 hypothetical protein PPTG_18359 [Phytophthora nicotianae INRA-310]